MPMPNEILVRQAFECQSKDGPSLTLKLWPGGKTRLLARADAHCRKVDWLG